MTKISDYSAHSKRGRLRSLIYPLLGCLLVLTAFVPYASAQEKITIFSVGVQGNVTASSDIIKRNSGLVEGKAVSGDDIQSAIRKLWELGIFSNIEILVEKQVEEGVYLLIVVEEYLRLDKFELKGNKKIKDDDIEDELNTLMLFKGKVVSLHLQNRAIMTIRNLYKKKGYLLAEVSTEHIPSDKENYEILRFNIKEGPKVKIRGIHIEGVEAFSEGKMKKQMKETKEKGFLRFWRKGDFDREKFEEDKELIVQFYRNHGYRDAEIVSDSLSYDETKEKLFIHITIREGLHYKFGDITFEGQELYTETELKKVFGLKKGDDYSREDLDIAVYDRLTGIYMDRGYIYVSIIPQEIPVAEDTVDVHFRMIENQQVSVRNVNIYGNTKTKEKVIRRELKIYPGDVFSRAQLIRSQREVFILNYFANVIPNIRPVDDDEVDVEIEVEEKQTDRANASAGYSGRDGMIGSVGVDFNNFLGNGQILSFAWQFGRIFRSFSIGFTEPWLFDTPTLGGFRVFDTRRRGYYFPLDQKEIGGSVSLGRRFRWPDDYFRGNMSFRVAQREFYNIKDAEILARLVPAEDLVEDPTGEDVVIKTSQRSLSMVLSRDSRDRPEFPTEGSVVTLSTQISGGPFGGGEDFHKHTFRLNWYTPIFWKFVLFNEFQFGALNSFSSSSFIPWDEYYFMGGSGLTIGVPLRGYDDRTVGPLAGDRYALGARTMAKYGTELRFPIAPNPTIFGLFFIEAGNTWLDLKTTDPFDLRKSAGFGLRMFMPLVGLIGFDLGYGFDDLYTQGQRSGWKVHFQFGRGF